MSVPESTTIASPATRACLVVRDPARDVPTATRPEPLPVIPQQHLAQRVVGALRPSPAHQAFPHRLFAAARCCTPSVNTFSDCFSSGAVTVMRASI